MAHKRDIKIKLIAKTQIDREAAREWLDDLGADQFQLPAISDPEALVVLGAKRCYNAFQPGLNPNVTKVRSNWVEYLDNILKSGHGSVLSHAWYTFAIEGVTRVFTAEQNRHGIGTAISEASQRYIRLDDIGYWEPLSIQDKPEDDELTRTRKAKTREVFAMAFKAAEGHYKLLCDLWDIDNEKSFDTKKKLTSMFRRLAPQGTSTGGVWSGNLRSLRHILALRSTDHAEEEIAYVWTEIGKIMVEEAPFVFQDFERDANGFWVPKYHKV